MRVTKAGRERETGRHGFVLQQTGIRVPRHEDTIEASERSKAKHVADSMLRRDAYISVAFRHKSAGQTSWNPHHCHEKMQHGCIFKVYPNNDSELESDTIHMDLPCCQRLASFCYSIRLVSYPAYPAWV